MKALKVLLVILVSFFTVAAGVLILLQKDKKRNYVGIYGEDEVAY